VAIIICVPAATALGNTGLISVLPAIGRSIGIPDPMVSAIFSLSELLWAFSSPWWARASDRRGRKPLMMVGLAGFMVSMTLCGFVVSAGLRHLASTLVIFVAFLLCRALFGLFGAAPNRDPGLCGRPHTTRQRSPWPCWPARSASARWSALPGADVHLSGPGASRASLHLCADRGVMLVMVWRYLPEHAAQA
jgi:MFS family permease